MAESFDLDVLLFALPVKLVHFPHESFDGLPVRPDLPLVEVEAQGEIGY